MSDKRIAVFTTSEIFTYGDSTHVDGGARLVHDFTAEERSRLRISDGSILVSTGALESAIEQGFEVWVVSTRYGGGPHDTWWMQLVPPERVMWALSDEAYTEMLRTPRADLSPAWVRHIDDDDHAFPMALPWLDLYTDLGLTYPMVDHGAGEEPEFWLAARDHLADKHGIRLGNSFSRRHEFYEKGKAKALAIKAARERPRARARRS